MCVLPDLVVQLQGPQREFVVVAVRMAQKPTILSYNLHSRAYMQFPKYTR